MMPNTATLCSICHEFPGYHRYSGSRVSQHPICESCYRRTPEFQKEQKRFQKEQKRAEVYAKQWAAPSKAALPNPVFEFISGIFAFLLLLGFGLATLSFVGSMLFGPATVENAFRSASDFVHGLDDFDKELRRVVNTIDLKSKSDEDFQLDSIGVSHRKVTFTISINLLSLRVQGITKAQVLEAIKIGEQTPETVYHNPNTDYFEMVWVFNDQHDGTYLGKISDKIILKDGQDFSNAVRSGADFNPGREVKRRNQ